MPSIKGDYHFNEKDQSLIRFVTYSNEWKKTGYRLPVYIVTEMMVNLNVSKFVLVDRQNLDQYEISTTDIEDCGTVVKGAKENEISIPWKYFEKSDFIGAIPKKRTF
jgi:hypothetical protein